MDEKQIEARMAALEKKLEDFESHTVEVLNNLAASLNTERRIVANLIEVVTGRPPAARGKVKN